MRKVIDEAAERIGTVAVALQDLAERLTGVAAGQLLRAVGAMNEACDALAQVYHQIGSRESRALDAAQATFRSAIDRGAAGVQPRVSKWVALQATFLEVYSRVGSVERAAEATGFSAFVHYRELKADPTYAAAFEAARRPWRERVKAVDRLPPLRDPRAARERADGCRRKFLDTYRETGSVMAAARAAGVGHQRHAKWLKAFTAYRDEFEGLRAAHAPLP